MQFLRRYLSNVYSSQEPAKLFSHRLESKRFRPCGPGGLCHRSAEVATDHSHTQGHGCVPIKLYLQKQAKGYFSSFLSSGFFVRPVCMINPNKTSPPLNCPEWTDIFVTRIWPTKSETGLPGTGEENHVVFHPCSWSSWPPETQQISSLTHGSQTFSLETPFHFQELLLMWVKSTSTYHTRNWNNF